MEKSYKISVIVPVFNASLTLRKCIESIQLQSFSDFELLLINDGSTDDSGDICEEYARKDIRISVFHHINEGVSKAREFGTNIASGQYSIHVDSDDWIEKDMLQSLYHNAIQTNADMVICDILFDIEGKSHYGQQKPKRLEGRAVINDILTGKVMGSTCNKLIRHEIYKELDIHYPCEINYCEDAYVIIQILLHAKNIKHIPTAFYHYVMNPASLSHNVTKITFTHRKRYIEALQQLLGPTYSSSIAQNLVYIREDAYYSRLYTSRELCNFFPYHRLAVFKSSRRFRIKLLLFFASIGLCSIAHLLERKKDRQR